MLFISDKEVSTMLQGHMSEVVETMRRMFCIMEKGDYVLGGKNGGSHGMRIAFDHGDGEQIFLAMPGFLGGGTEFNVAGVKWHGPNRPVQGNDADSYFIVALSDANTGRPFAIMRGDALTLYRTAAVNALAAEALTSSNPATLAIVGPGRIARLTLEYLLKRFPSINCIHVKGRGHESRDQFIVDIRTKYSRVNVVPCETLKEAILESDISIINAGFHFKKYSDMPVVKSSWIKPGSVFICSAFAGFPDSMLIENSIKVCDLYKSYECYEEELGYPAYRKFGAIGCRFADLVNEGKLSRDEIFDLSNIVSGKMAIKNPEKKPILFSSSGLALEDLALGMHIYNFAKEDGIGTELD